MFRNIISEIYIKIKFNNDLDIGDYYLKELDDKVKAEEFYLKAAKRGYKLAYLKLSELYDGQAKHHIALYYSALYLEECQEWTNAIKKYKELSKFNFEPRLQSEAYYRLGFIYAENRYDNGILISPINLGKAIEYYTQAALQFHKLSINALQYLVDHDDNAFAAYNLAVICNSKANNFEKAAEYCMFSAKKGYAEAHKWLFENRLKLSNEYLFELINSFSIAKPSDHLQILEYYKVLIDRKDSKAISDIDKLFKFNPNIAYKFGMLYEVDSKEDIAIFYYFTASNLKDNESRKKIKSLLPKLDEYRKVEFATIIFKVFEEKLAGLKILQQLQKDGSKLAETKFLELIKQSPQNAFDLATENEKVWKEVFYKNPNMDESEFNYYKDRTLENYLLAADLNHQEALKHIERFSKFLNLEQKLKLGSIYERSRNFLSAFNLYASLTLDRNYASTAKTKMNHLAHQDNDYAYNFANFYKSKDDLANASKYYFIAAKKNHKPSFDALETLYKSLDSGSCLQLGKIYLNRNNTLMALKCFKHLSDADYDAANNEISKLINNPEHAYSLGKLYEAENKTNIALNYYFLAATFNHDQSLAIIETFYYLLDDLHRFKLAQIYNEQNKKIEAFKIYKELNERNYAGAESELKKLSQDHANTYLIAKHCEQEKMFDEAIDYYLIASEGNKVALSDIDKIISKNNINLTDDTRFVIAKLYLKHNDVSTALQRFKELADNNHQISILELNKLAENSQYAFQIAKLYIAKNKQRAFDYYLKAAIRIKDALFELENIKIPLSDNARCFIAKLYLKHNDVSAALQRFKELADNNHQISILELNKLVENSQYAFQLAKLYEAENNLKQALNYYLIAAKKQHHESIAILERPEVQNKLSKGQLLELCQIYLNQTNRNQEKAAKIIKFLLDNNYARAKEGLNWVYQNAECSYQLALLLEHGIKKQLSEQDDNNNLSETNNIEKEIDLTLAINLYLIAANNKHNLALNQLIELAQNGNVIAQYKLGSYYHHHNNRDQAIKWSMLAAELDYHLAKDYLAKTAFTGSEYFSIAQKYEIGDGVKANQQLAVTFYQKAYSTGNITAARWLGYHFLEMEDKDAACDYLIHTARYGNDLNIIPTIECLFDDVTPENQHKIAELFKSGPSGVQDSYKASLYFDKANENQSAESFFQTAPSYYNNNQNRDFDYSNIFLFGNNNNAANSNSNSSKQVRNSQVHSENDNARRNKR